MDSDSRPSNVSRETLGQPPGPCAMVIFGAGGDLTKRKLIPAIYNLAKGNLLPEQFAIVGVSAEPFTTEEFRDRATTDIKEYSTVPVEASSWDWFIRRIYYLSGDFNDQLVYGKLEALLKKVEQEQGTQGNALFYLATGPNFFTLVVKRLGQAGLTGQSEKQWRRVVIEKPFGQDLSSAVALNHDILEVLDEKQVFRIDHYLG